MPHTQADGQPVLSNTSFTIGPNTTINTAATVPPLFVYAGECYGPNITVTYAGG